MKRLKRRCSWCRSAFHTDRHDKNDRAICPERRKFEARMDRRRSAVSPSRGDCTTCGDEPATVEVLLGKTRRSGAYWVGRRCAAMFEQLAIALGGSPRRVPRLEVVR